MSTKKSQPQQKAAMPERMDAFVVREYEVSGEKKSDWSKIGCAWPHSDGKGFRIVLTAVPVDGVVILRTHEQKPE